MYPPLSNLLLDALPAEERKHLMPLLEPVSLPLPLPLPPMPVVQTSIAQRMQWQLVPRNPETPLWRDDFANLLKAWKKREE